MMITTSSFLFLATSASYRARGFSRPVASGARPERPPCGSSRRPRRAAFRPRRDVVVTLTPSTSSDNSDGVKDAEFNFNGAEGFFVQQLSSAADAEDCGDFSSADLKCVLERQDVGNAPWYEPETYFVATYNGTNTDDNEADDELEFQSGGKSGRKNVIVGVVSAQLRRRSPLIAGPGNDEGSSSAPTAALPSVPLPSPHVYIANMKVDERMRRKGAATALLISAREYADSWGERIGEEMPVVLSVENDNVGAVALYEKAGFEYLERNDVFRMMVMWP